jgi:hypothetical protein
MLLLDRSDRFLNVRDWHFCEVATDPEHLHLSGGPAHSRRLPTRCQRSSPSRHTRLLAHLSPTESTLLRLSCRRQDMSTVYCAAPNLPTCRFRHRKHSNWL